MVVLPFLIIAEKIIKICTDQGFLNSYRPLAGKAQLFVNTGKIRRIEEIHRVSLMCRASFGGKIPSFCKANLLRGCMLDRKRTVLLENETSSTEDPLRLSECCPALWL